MFRPATLVARGPTLVARGLPAPTCVVYWKGAAAQTGGISAAATDAGPRLRAQREWIASRYSDEPAWVPDFQSVELASAERGYPIILVSCRGGSFAILGEVGEDLVGGLDAYVGRGLSFQVSSQCLMSASRSATLWCTLRCRSLVVISANQRSTRFSQDEAGCSSGALRARKPTRGARVSFTRSFCERLGAQGEAVYRRTREARRVSAWDRTERRARRARDHARACASTPGWSRSRRSRRSCATSRGSSSNCTPLVRRSTPGRRYEPVGPRRTPKARSHAEEAATSAVPAIVIATPIHCHGFSRSPNTT